MNRLILYAMAAMALLTVLPADAESGRDKALRYSKALERDPLAEDAEEKRAWVLEWLGATPDFTVTVCEVFDIDQLKDATHAKAIFSQLLIGNFAYQAEHPGARDEQRAQLAGIESVLKVYTAI